MSQNIDGVAGNRPAKPQARLEPIVAQVRPGTGDARLLLLLRDHGALVQRRSYPGGDQHCVAANMRRQSADRVVEQLGSRIE
jgi:hypothetical protein